MPPINATSEDSLLGKWYSRTFECFFLGSDDFPKEAKLQAARDLNAALEAGWPGFEIGERIPLADIARAARACGTPGPAAGGWSFVL